MNCLLKHANDAGVDTVYNTSKITCFAGTPSLFPATNIHGTVLGSFCEQQENVVQGLYSKRTNYVGTPDRNVPKKKRPLEKRLLPLSDISYYYVQRKGFATSTYCVTSYIHWSLAKPKPAKLSSKPSCFLFFFFLPNCIMAKNAKVLKMETLC